MPYVPASVLFNGIFVDYNDTPGYAPGTKGVGFGELLTSANTNRITYALALNLDDHEARINSAATLDGSYRNGANNDPEIGRHITVDGGPVELTAAQAGWFGPVPSLLKLRQSGSSVSQLALDIVAHSPGDEPYSGGIWDRYVYEGDGINTHVPAGTNVEVTTLQVPDPYVDPYDFVAFLQAARSSRYVSEQDIVDAGFTDPSVFLNPPDILLYPTELAALLATVTNAVSGVVEVELTDAGAFWSANGSIGNPYDPDPVTNVLHGSDVVELSVGGTLFTGLVRSVISNTRVSLLSLAGTSTPMWTSEPGTATLYRTRFASIGGGVFVSAEPAEPAFSPFVSNSVTLERSNSAALTLGADAGQDVLHIRPPVVLGGATGRSPRVSVSGTGTVYFTQYRDDNPDERYRGFRGFSSVTRTDRAFGLFQSRLATAGHVVIGNAAGSVSGLDTSPGRRDDFLSLRGTPSVENEFTVIGNTTIEFDNPGVVNSIIPLVSVLELKGIPESGLYVAQTCNTGTGSVTLRTLSGATPGTGNAEPLTAGARGRATTYNGSQVGGLTGPVSQNPVIGSIDNQLLASAHFTSSVEQGSTSVALISSQYFLRGFRPSVESNLVRLRETYYVDAQGNAMFSGNASVLGNVIAGGSFLYDTPVASSYTTGLGGAYIGRHASGSWNDTISPFRVSKDGVVQLTWGGADGGRTYYLIVPIDPPVGTELVRSGSAVYFGSMTMSSGGSFTVAAQIQRQTKSSTAAPVTVMSGVGTPGSVANYALQLTGGDPTHAVLADNRYQLLLEITGPGAGTAATADVLSMCLQYNSPGPARW